MKKINLLLRKCKSLSRQLARSSSYSNLRSKSTREDLWISNMQEESALENSKFDENQKTIFVGSTRKRYVVSTKYLNHPLLEALMDKSKPDALVVKCEVVLFDHLLWMLENADPVSLGSESMEELAALYVF
ncbi:hypothetical protein UlMin_007595 [Ulmus minor]